MTILLLAAVLTAAPACPSTRPADTASVTWVCVDGGWRPTAPTPAPVPPPAPPPLNQPNPTGFKVGRTYQRDATGTQLAILALAQDTNGLFVYVAQCLTDAPQDGCYGLGAARFILANANTSGWTDITIP